MRPSLLRRPRRRTRRKARDPEMRQNEEGQRLAFWNEGARRHRSARHRAQPEHDGGERARQHQMSKLLHGEEREVFGDQAYWSESHRRPRKAGGIRYRINRRANRRTPVEPHIERCDQPPPIRRSSPSRACLSRGEAPVGLHQGSLSRIWRRTPRDCYTSFALANLYHAAPTTAASAVELTTLIASDEKREKAEKERRKSADSRFAEHPFNEIY